MRSFPKFLLFVAACFLAVSCYESKPAPKYPVEGAVDLSQPVPPSNGNINTTEPAQNANGIWHYICSAGCAGGAGSAGNCATCGGALAHNAAYHN
ncbi:MAG: hypothetical protein AAGJ18_06275 [Bacteroidota bacterium]